jgi:hypothetical protein
LLAPRESLEKLKDEDLIIEYDENNSPKVILPNELKENIKVKSLRLN